MLNLTLNSQPGLTVVTAWKRSLYVCGVAVLASCWLTSARPLAVVAMAVSFLVFSIIRISTPPAVVFLGTSDVVDLKWHWTLLFLARPLRVVSCLDLTNPQALVESWTLTFDCFRSPPDKDWWATVQELLQLTPLVLIDGTVDTPDLEREVRSLVSEQAWKCIVLCGPNGESDLLDAAGVPKDALCAVPTDAVVSVVTQILARGELPRPDRPVSLIVSEMGQRLETLL